MAKSDLEIEIGVSLQKLHRQLARVETDFRKAASRQEKAFAAANEKVARDFENLKKRANASLAGIGLPGGLGGIGAGLVGALSTREIIAYADAWTVAGNKIAAASELAGRQARSLAGVNDIATETRAGLTETADLYAKLMRATAKVAQSEQEVATATELVNKAFKAGGAAASEQAAGILQLGQALGSGVMQGDELRSVRENAPIIAQAIADEFKTTIAGLKDLGSEGKLTSDRVFKAILAAQPQIEAAFGKTNATIGDGFTRLRNAVTEYIGSADKSVGASAKLAGALAYLAENLDLVVAAAGLLGGKVLGPTLAAMLVSIAGVMRAAAAGLVGLATGATTAATAMTGLRAALGFLGGPVGLILTALAAIPLVTTSAAERTEAMRTAGAGAATALDTYAEAAKRAAEQQKSLGGEVDLTTQKMLAQGRVALQEQLRALEAAARQSRERVTGKGGSLSSFDIGENLSALKNGIVRSDLDEAIKTLQSARWTGEGFNSYLAPLAASLDAVRAGKGDLRALVIEMTRLAGAGKEVNEAVADFDKGVDALGATAFREAQANLVRIAGNIGGFRRELEAIQNARTPEEMGLAFAALRGALLKTSEAGEMMRTTLFDGLRKDLTELSTAEQMLLAVKAALAGNLDAARQLAAGANPFATIEAGAAAATTQVQTLKEAMEAIPKELQVAVTGLENVSSGVEAATQWLQDKESFRSKPYDDGRTDGDGKRVGPPVWRAGYGSDTYTPANGIPVRVVQGSFVSREDAERDLARRLRTEFMPAARNAVGGQVFDALTPAQQGILGSLSYNYGAGAWDKGLAGVAAAVRSGNAQAAAEAIAALQGHNGGINRDRRLAEASVFASGVGIGGSRQRGAEAERAHQDAVKARDKAEEEAAKKRKEAEEEAAKKLADTLKLRGEIVDMGKQQVADAEFELSIMDRSAVEQEKARLRYQLINKAKQEGIALTDKLAGSEKTVGEAIEEQVAKVGEITARREEQAKGLEDLAQRQQFFNGLQDQMKSGLIDAIVEGKNFADVLKNVAAQLAKAALQAALFGEGPMAKGGTGALSGLFSGLFGGFRAQGGPVSPGQAYVVGEHRPELFVPRVPGTILPRVPTGGAGGNSTMIIDLRGTTGDAALDAKIRAAGKVILAQARREAPAAVADRQKRGPF